MVLLNSKFGTYLLDAMNIYYIPDANVSFHIIEDLIFWIVREIKQILCWHSTGRMIRKIFMK